jgi:hypothetical protein
LQFKDSFNLSIIRYLAKTHWNWLTQQNNDTKRMKSRGTDASFDWSLTQITWLVLLLGNVTWVFDAF